MLLHLQNRATYINAQSIYWQIYIFTHNLTLYSHGQSFSLSQVWGSQVSSRAGKGRQEAPGCIRHTFLAHRLYSKIWDSHTHAFGCTKIDKDDSGGFQKAVSHIPVAMTSKWKSKNQKVAYDLTAPLWSPSVELCYTHTQNHHQKDGTFKFVSWMN